MKSEFLYKKKKYLGIRLKIWIRVEKRSFKRDIFISNLFLIDFYFIILYPRTHAHFLDSFYPNPHNILKYEL